MKKKLTILFAAATLFIGSAFANSTAPSQQLQTEFSRIFTNATDVKWETVSPLYKVSFRQGANHLTAFFNPDGKIESLSRNIPVSALPLVLQKGVQDKLDGGWISESFELVGKGGTAYYVTIENADAQTLYHASDSNWAVYKKIKK